MDFDETSPLKELLPLILQLEDKEEAHKLEFLCGRSQRYLLEGNEREHDAVIYLIKERLGLKK